MQHASFCFTQYGCGVVREGRIFCRLSDLECEAASLSDG